MIFQRLLLPALLASTFHSSVFAAPLSRERLRFDDEWKFHLGNEWGSGQNLAKAGTGMGPASSDFSDASWRQLDLPHDWAIETPFDSSGDASHGFRSVGPGFAANSVGWYRKVISIPATDAGKRLWLEFDGVFRDATVFVNGWAVGHHEGGYDSFRYDITDVVNPGQNNVIAVKVDASQNEGWFYEGAGIYRHVWLVKSPEVAIAPDGVFVRSTFENAEASGPATLHVETDLANPKRRAGSLAIQHEVLAANGTVVATLKTPVNVADANTPTTLSQLTIKDPILWTPENPVLYTLVTRLVDGSTVTDETKVTFGIRTTAFDAKRGFLLNGKPYVIKGTCNHQDHAGVGAALPDRLQYFRIAKLKEMGSNAYRTAHNPPTPELLDACDRLGMLVMDENRLLGSDAASLERVARFVRRDRNHASVLIWSLANEEFTVQATDAGGRVAASMQALIQDLDPSRPITYNAPQGNEFSGINAVIQVRGWSYHVGKDSMDAYHAAHPEQPNVGSEQGSTTTTRGIYKKDPARGYNTAYDIHAESWSNTAKEWWSFFKDRPWLSGGFVWTGFDYRGEPTPYAWPCINSHFGIYDTCGFPKDNFWNYKAWWTNETVLHVMPHWNWSGKEGQPIEVNVLTNCEEVELFLNGRSLGKKVLAPALSLAWTVPYEKGVLSAKGYRQGKEIASSEVATTGNATSVTLSSDRTALTADGSDVAVITVAVADAAGKSVPIADNEISFTVDGPGRLLGVGNGDPSCHEPDTFVTEPVLTTKPVTGWRWTLVKDIEAPALPELAENVDDSSWKSADVDGASGPLGLQERGVFRARFDVSENELHSEAIEMEFGKIDGDGVVYVNGNKVGRTGDPRASSLYSIKSFLKPGKNLVVVALANWNPTAGIHGGVRLRVVTPGTAPAWKRSLFNGYAQVLVQTGKKPGQIVLTATGRGLTPATVSLQSAPTLP